MLIHKLRFTIVTLLAFAAFRHRRGVSDSHPGDEGRAQENSGRFPTAAGGKPNDGTRVRPRAGCSWLAACSTRKASRCQRKGDGDAMVKRSGTPSSFERLSPVRDRPRGRRRIGPVSP